MKSKIAVLKIFAELATSFSLAHLIIKKKNKSLKCYKDGLANVWIENTKFCYPLFFLKEWDLEKSIISKLGFVRDIMEAELTEQVPPLPPPSPI